LRPESKMRFGNNLLFRADFCRYSGNWEAISDN
jgi:hypothetical protein